MALSTREMLRQPVIDRSAWKGSELRQDASWIYVLPQRAIDDIDAALQTCSVMPLTSIRQENFPLPSIAADLAGLIEEVENGRGFVVVRGLPFGKYDDDQVGRIFWGIGTYLGDAIPQNAQGDLLGHVKAVEGMKYMEKNVRGYQTSAELFFHNDNSDVVGLLCFRKAKAGGLSRITSAITIYNQVLRQHPEFLETVCTGFQYDLRGEEREGFAPVTPHRIPIYSYFDGKLSSRYVYTAIMQAARKGGLTIADHEREAMAFLNETAAREDLRLEMMLEPGDMQFLNNHVILHSRTSFEDFDEPDRRRHMLRLWLNVRNGRKLAPEFLDRYGKGVGMGVPPKEPAPAMHSRRTLLAVLCAVLAHSVVEDAAAQSAYPSKPVRMIVPFPPGGTTDIVARGIAQLMSASWGQQLIVDNRAGASGAIGAALAAQAPPDGYTLVMASTAILAINPHLRRDLPYNVRRDFAPVSLAVVTPNLLAVHPSLPVRSVKALLELAKAKPDGITFGSSGIGSVGHLALEQFRTLGGVRMLHVPYKGALPAEVDLLAGHIAVMASGIVSLLPHVKSGRVRGLAVTSAKRTPLLPDMPAVSEVLPGFDAGAWFGVLAPAGTPAPILEQLHRAIAAALRTPDLRARLSANGAEVVGSSPQEFQRYIGEESERYGRLLAGIAPGT